MTSIATLGSHCSLQVLKGAKDEGFKTILVCEKKREKLYRRFSFIDELIIVEKFSEILNQEIQDNPPKTAKFSINPGVIIMADDGEILEPGSDKIGLIGTSGLVPVGYYKDEKKSSETFREVNGTRYSFPGDYAKLEADGTITLLGRGSNCINSAGEKIYPEEVEEAIKRNDEVFDCLVVGVDDDKFGQRVVAVASLTEGFEISESELIESTRTFIAGYKLPKKLILVDNVQRAPNGKADYKWAKEIANKHTN